MRQLNSVDAMMLALETSSHPNHVAAISIYDPSTAPGGEITIERILDYITPRLRLAPPFRQKLVRVPLHLDEPYWVEERGDSSAPNSASCTPARWTCPDPRGSSTSSEASTAWRACRRVPSPP